MQILVSGDVKWAVDYLRMELTGGSLGFILTVTQ